METFSESLQQSWSGFCWFASFPFGVVSCLLWSKGSLTVLDSRNRRSPFSVKEELLFTPKEITQKRFCFSLSPGSLTHKRKRWQQKSMEIAVAVRLGSYCVRWEANRRDDPGLCGLHRSVQKSVWSFKTPKTNIFQSAATRARTYHKQRFFRRRPK